MKQPMINYVQNEKNDEFYTPEYAIKPILKYLKPNSIIWCPFDKVNSNFVKVLKENGHNVINTHIDNEVNFLETFKDGKKCISYQKQGRCCYFINKIDYIISNPPYSIKDKVLEHLYKLGIPFLMLMPITTLEGVKRSEMFRQYGIQALIFDKRINYMKDKKSNWFNTSYFGWKVLPKDLIFESLESESEWS